MATIKHLSSKNSDLGAAERYLIFQHDESCNKPILDADGHLIPREDYRIDSVLCGDEDFAIACMKTNLAYNKNLSRGDVKTHHYIISFDPRDADENGLTMDRAQELGLDFCKKHFPGHQALVCTHPDGHNKSGNIHVHIIFNSLRKLDVDLLPFMDQMLERLAGQSFHCFLDGYSGYNQIVVDPQDQEKTAFTCPFGVFAYRRMPFGLCNALATF